MMVRRARAALPLLFLLLVGLATAGCSRSRHEHFQSGQEMERTRSLYDPLVAGQVRLSDALARLDRQVTVFRLSPQGARKTESPDAGRSLGDPASAVFIQFARVDTPDTRETAYLNPATLRLEPLSTDESAGTGAAGGSDWVPAGPGRFSLVRSLPEEGLVKWRGARRSIVRFDFELGEDGSPAYLGAERITETGNWDTFPMVKTGSSAVVFLRRGEDGRSRLWLTDLGGGAAREVFPGAEFEVRAPRALADSRFIFSANPRGYFELHEAPFPVDAASSAGGRDAESGAGMQLFRDTSMPSVREEVLIAQTSLDGKGLPELLQLPEVYDLESLVALTVARNPHINQKRALLAATLAEAAQRRFDVWPTVSLGMFYTPLVGVFLEEPLIASGDFIAEGISRGVFGMAQPLLDFRRNQALTEADVWRAEIVRDGIAGEINDRAAEVAELYFEARHLERQLVIQQELIENEDRRVAYFRTLRAQGEAMLSEVLAAEQSRDAIRSESEFRSRRLRFVKNRIREVCNLPAATPMDLDDRPYFLDRCEPEALEQLRHRALMNRPDLSAADSALSQAFYEREVGPSRRPTAYASATYGQSRREFTTPVDDFITLTLQGEYPLGSWKTRRLFNEQWDRAMEALGHEREAMMRATASAVEVAYLDFSTAQRDFESKRIALLSSAEELRVARIQTDYGPPRETARVDVTTELNARHAYLAALSRIAQVELELGLRYSRLWREMGLASRLPREAERWSGEGYRQGQPAVWMWDTRDVMGSDAALEEFAAVLARLEPRRVYAYLYSDSLLLDDPRQREKLITLMHFFQARDVEFWALLGEPEWTEAGDMEAVKRAVGRILAFNEAQPPMEPRIAGVKLDLEPHSLPGWAEGGEAREALVRNYIALLGAAREGLDGRLPLWADLSTQYLRTENEALLGALTPLLDGATLMCYFNRPERIEREGLAALGRYPGPLEIGMELSEQAPEDVRIPRMSGKDFEAMARSLTWAFEKHENFQGLALHDYRGVVKYFEEAPAEPIAAGAGE